MRHLISGDDWAIAGEATAATAAPVADTFKKSRRFIQTLLILLRAFPGISWSTFNGEANSQQPTTLGRVGLTRMPACGNATGLMMALIKRKLNATILPMTSAKSPYAAAIAPCS
jgi:hypothetical protein